MISVLPKSDEKHTRAVMAAPWISNADFSLVPLPSLGIASIHMDEGDSSSYFSS